MASENTLPASVTSATGKSERTELVDGRVRRRISSAIHQDKANGGPVLRTTVKPVKRFRPDSNVDKTNPSPNRKKRLKTFPNLPSKTDESIAASGTSAGISEGKKVLNHESIQALSPDGKHTPTTETEKFDKQQQESQVTGDCSTRKKKRVWEQWSVEDKDYFFEAIAMYGKDFEAIRSAIAQKHRRKGQDSMAKTKDQVRHFYYRTWAMINKMIDSEAYPLEINKAFQELYALINYGELRRKLGGNLKKKGIDKLNELIKHGTTSARVKGKNFRIKTPSCRALKKLNPEYQGKEGTLDLPLVSDTRRMKVPLTVAIDLYPLTMADWNKVHSLAHNPRLRVRLPVESQLSTLFNYLGRKWKPPSDRLLCYANKMWCTDQTNQSISTSQECGKLVLQTPADASVNTRIMVSSNKSHAVVSYALRKSTRAVEKSSKETVGKTLDSIKQSSVPIFEATNGSVSETEAIDSCLSSEDDFDYDSANDEVARVLKDVEGDDDTRASPKQARISVVDDCCVGSLDTIFTVKSRENNAVQGSDAICDQKLDIDDDPQNADQSEERTVTEQTSNQSDAHNLVETVSEESHSLMTAANIIPNTESGSPATDDKLQVPENVFEKCHRKKKYRTVKNSDFIKSIQTWNPDDSANTTIAEIYMMLGKPSVFKLCYHWLQSATNCNNNATAETNSEEESPKKASPVSNLSSGLLALLQAADLSRQHICSKDSGSMEPKAPDGSSRSKTLGVQCELIKAPSVVEAEQTTKVVENGGTEKQHSRGLRKTVGHNSATGGNVESATEFAVPSTPVNQRKKNTDGASNITVSPETMHWLLQKERSRCRQMRRPVVIERPSQNRPIRASMRTMKTFSIVMQGPKKVGFLPAETVSVPVDESIAEETPDFLEVSNQDKDQGVPLDYYMEGLAPSCQSSLLEQAAQEAGVLPPEMELATTSTDTPIHPVTNKSVNEANFAVDDPIDAALSQQIGGPSVIETIPVTSAASMIAESPMIADSVNANSDTVESIMEQLSWNPGGVETFSLASDSGIESSLHFEASAVTNSNAPSVFSPSITDCQSGEKAVTEEPSSDSVDSSSLITNADQQSLLVTPQKVMPADFEDSFDGLLPRNPSFENPPNSSLNLDQRVNSLLDGIKLPSVEKGGAQEHGPSGADLALDLQLPGLIGEDSVDLVSKFQDLVQSTTQNDEFVNFVNDCNHNDGLLASNSFQSLNSSCNYDNG